MTGRSLFLILNAIVLLMAIFFYFFSGGEYDRSILLTELILASILLFSFIFIGDEYAWLKGQAFKCSTLFLLGYIIVHFQLYCDVLLGNISETDRFFMVNPAVINKGGAISLAGLSSFFLGYCCSKGKIFKAKSAGYVSIGGLIAFSAILLFVRFFLVGFDRFVYGGYASGGGNPLTPYISILLEMSLWACIFFHSRNFRIKGIAPSLGHFVLSFGWYNALVAGYVLSSFMLGGRQMAIAVVCIYFLGYVYASGVRISKMKLVALSVVAAFVLTFVGLARSSSTGESLSSRIATALDTEFTTDTISPYTLELGGSVRCLHWGLENVPSTHPFLFGRFQLSNICSIVPTGSRWMMLTGILPPERRYATSADFITWLIQGEVPTSGDGSTCVVDLYLDFGFWGCVFGLFTWGFWVRRFDVNLYVPHIVSPLLYAFIFVYLGKAIFLSRSSILFELKSVFWFFIIIFTYELFFSKKSFSTR